MLNYKLYKLFANDEEAGKYATKLKAASNTDVKQALVKKLINRLCDILSVNFENKKIEKPNIEFSTNIATEGVYHPSTNTIILDPDYLTLPNIMHEFRHYIQFQFKEQKYLKGLLTPLGRPFYNFQSHEICAYNFQRMYNEHVGSDLKIFQDYVMSADRLLSLGLFSKKVFDTERKYYKTYNTQIDIQDADEKALKLKFPCMERKSFINTLDKTDIAVTYNDVGRKLFNIKYNVKNTEYETNFEITDDKCIIYGININNRQYATFRNYKRACQISVDYAANVAMAFSLDTIDINPYSIFIHKNKFKDILDLVKQDYCLVDRQNDFNNIIFYKPKEEIEDQFAEFLGIVKEAETKINIGEPVREFSSEEKEQNLSISKESRIEEISLGDDDGR